MIPDSCATCPHRDGMICDSTCGHWLAYEEHERRAGRRLAAWAALLIIGGVVALVACPAHAAPCTGDGHNLHRSEAAKSAFRHAHPCPGGPDKGSTRRCRGYVIDHICALACCGKDAPTNMQWQTRADSKAKDRWETTPAGCARTCPGMAGGGVAGRGAP